MSCSFEYRTKTWEGKITHQRKLEDQLLQPYVSGVGKSLKTFLGHKLLSGWGRPQAGEWSELVLQLVLSVFHSLHWPSRSGCNHPHLLPQPTAQPPPPSQHPPSKQSASPNSFSCQRHPHPHPPPLSRSTLLVRNELRKTRCWRFQVQLVSAPESSPTLWTCLWRSFNFFSYLWKSSFPLIFSPILVPDHYQRNYSFAVVVCSFVKPLNPDHII